MNAFFILLWLASIPAFIVYWWKKRKARLAAGEDYQNDLNYQSKSKIKRIIGVVSVAALVMSLVTTPESTPQNKTQVAAENTVKDTKTTDDTISEKIAEQEKLLKEMESETDKKAEEEKAAAEKKAEEERLAAEKKAKEEKAVADKKAKEIADFEKKHEKDFASLNEESKAFYEKTYSELIKEEGLFSKHKYSEEEAREEALERALNKQRSADKKVKEQEENLAKAKERLAHWAEIGKIQYQYLENGAVNVILTETADFKFHGTSETDKIDIMLRDEHEKNILTTASQCMDMVQDVKDAGVQADNFEIHLRGNAVDSEGYKSVKDIVICEIPGNKNFKRNDPYSFYNSVSRYWMMNGL